MAMMLMTTRRESLAWASEWKTATLDECTAANTQKRLYDSVTQAGGRFVTHQVGKSRQWLREPCREDVGAAKLPTILFMALRYIQRSIFLIGIHNPGGVFINEMKDLHLKPRLVD